VTALKDITHDNNSNQRKRRPISEGENDTKKALAPNTKRRPVSEERMTLKRRLVLTERMMLKRQLNIGLHHL
jgi:hypothetical protein